MKKDFIKGLLLRVLHKLCASILGILALSAAATAATATAAPTVNGLFFGDGDQNRYVLYNTSVGGSKLWYTVADNRLYVALVVDRSVNDNLFANKSGKDYTSSAGWNPPHLASRLIDSEFASFTLTVGDTEFEWQQGYGEEINGEWISDHTTGAGSGTPPPDYVSASSFAWNINNYLSNPSPAWDLFADGTDIKDWRSPFDPANPDNAIGLEGYPESGPLTYSPTYQWEWAMVYEWSIDLASFGSDPIFVISGSSHHSPSKNDDENDPFPDPDPDSNPFLSDYGDLPAPYPTLEADNGPLHYIVPNSVSLGTGADPETDGTPHPEALGDDQLSGDDEDGVRLLSVTRGVSMTLEVIISAPGYLSAFFDLDQSGVLSAGNLLTSSGPAQLETGSILDLYIPQAGVYDLTIAAPVVGSQLIPSRFRVTNNAGEGGAAVGGVALTGEVEDHIFQWDDRGSLSAGIDLNSYTSSDGTVMLEISTTDETGSDDIVIYAQMDGKWVEVGRVPGSEIVGFGSHTYTTAAHGLEPGSNYRFKIIDEVGNTFFTSPVLVQSKKPGPKMHTLRLNGNALSLTFDTEPGARYSVQVSESLDPNAQWSTQKVQVVHPAFQGGISPAAYDVVQGAPAAASTTVSIPRNRKQAFFKIIKH